MFPKVYSESKQGTGSCFDGKGEMDYLCSHAINTVNDKQHIRELFDLQYYFSKLLDIVSVVGSNHMLSITRLIMGVKTW